MGTRDAAGRARNGDVEAIAAVEAAPEKFRNRAAIAALSGWVTKQPLEALQWAAANGVDPTTYRQRQLFQMAFKQRLRKNARLGAFTAGLRVARHRFVFHLSLYRFGIDQDWRAGVNGTTVQPRASFTCNEVMRCNKKRSAAENSACCFPCGSRSF